MKFKIILFCLITLFNGLLLAKDALADSSPDPFIIEDIKDVPTDVVISLKPIIISGIDEQTSVSIIGGEFSINDGGFDSATKTANNGDKINVQIGTASTYATTTEAALIVGDYPESFRITTDAKDLKPDIFGFAPLINIALDSIVTSNPIYVSGLSDSTDIWIENGQYSINDGPFTSEKGMVANGDKIVLQQTAASTPITTTKTKLFIHYVDGDFYTTTGTSSGNNIGQFIFLPKMDVPLSELIYSNEITVEGIQTPDTNISIFGGEYSINGDTFTNKNGAVKDGDKIVVRLPSSSEFNTTSSATLTIENVSGSFMVTTILSDIAPDEFNFIAQKNVDLNQHIQSKPIIVSGINTLSPVSITGGLYSINDGEFTNSPSFVSNGDKVIVEVLSPSDFSSTKSATILIGGVQEDFNVTTISSDENPEPISFTSQNEVALNTPAISNEAVISGINTPTYVAITNGEYSINGSDFTNKEGAISEGEKIVVKQVSSDKPNTTTVTILQVGKMYTSFKITTLSISKNSSPSLQFPEQNAIINIPFLFRAKAIDAENDNLIYKLGLNAPADINIDEKTGIISWLPKSVGTYTFDFNVSDGNSSDTKSLTIIVANPISNVASDNKNESESNSCGKLCSELKEYRKKYNNKANKNLYATMKSLQANNQTEFKRIENLYLKYKNLSNTEISKLASNVQQDLKNFKRFSGYKHYKHLKEKLG